MLTNSSAVSEQAAGLTQDRVLEILIQHGAILEGHFVLRSGLHSQKFVAKDALCVDWEVISLLCEGLVIPFIGDGIEVIASPATAGVAFSQWCAYHLSRLTGKKVKAVWADKMPNDTFAIRRVFPEHVKDRRILCVEDILTKGDSAAQTVQAVREVGGDVRGTTVIVNRGGVTAEKLGVSKLSALLNLNTPHFEPAKGKCPGCDADLPLQKPGGVR